MKLYIPIYTNKYEIITENSEELKQLGRTGKYYTKYKKGLGHYGTIYELPRIFTSEEACKKYINDWITDYSQVWSPEAE